MIIFAVHIFKSVFRYERSSHGIWVMFHSSFKALRPRHSHPILNGLLVRQGFNKPLETLCVAVVPQALVGSGRWSPAWINTFVFSSSTSAAAASLLSLRGGRSSSAPRRNGRKRKGTGEVVGSNNETWGRVNVNGKKRTKRRTKEAVEEDEDEIWIW